MINIPLILQTARSAVDHVDETTTTTPVMEMIIVGRRIFARYTLIPISIYYIITMKAVFRWQTNEEKITIRGL